MRCTWILALGVAFASPAFAQGSTSATEAGAQALSKELAGYVSQAAFDKKIVTVTPEGNGYRITFAPNAAIQPLLQNGMKVEVMPLSVLATERSDGNWDISASDPIGVVFDVTIDGNRQTADYQIEAGRFSGVYSPKLGAFLSGSGEYPSGTMTTSDPQSDIEATFGKTVYEITGKDLGEGAVNATTRQSVANLSEKISVKGMPGEAESPAAGMTVDVTVKDLRADADMMGLKSRAILDLWAFAVQHPDKEKVVADQETLRGLLTAALPLWTTIRGRYDLNAMEVKAELGSAAWDRLFVELKGDGVSTSSAFSYALGFDGLALRSPMMPAWAAGLTPESLDVTFKVDGLDLETPAKRAIADFDLQQPDVLPPETTQAIEAGFTRNPPRLMIEPSRLKTRDLDLSVEGDFAFEGAQPEMNVTVEATGIDKVISTLQAQAASDPSINEIVGGLQVAKGFAKALPDGRSQWIVATKADGSVVINGAQIVAPTPATPEIVAPEAGPAPTDENALPSEDPASEDPAEQPVQ